MTCPACGGGMREATFDGQYGRRVALDLCPGCNGIWFDGMESHQLTPGSTLMLFKQMGEAVAEANRPLGERKQCPRCQAVLTGEVDKQRTTSFEAFRCPKGHGRYLTFGAFLRAKNFVRDLTPTEMTELRRHVQSVKCTGCGAAVDVRTTSACGFCRAPIAMIDPDQLQRTIAELEARETRRRKAFPDDVDAATGGPRRDRPAGVDPMLPLRLAQERLRAERVFADLATHNRSAGGEAWDLFEVGLSSLVTIVKTIAST
ncbi:MAG: zf-TFIIB domain-containing protein [Vicinamibacteraceae bacterium]